MSDSRQCIDNVWTSPHFAKFKIFVSSFFKKVPPLFRDFRCLTQDHTLLPHGMLLLLFYNQVQVTILTFMITVQTCSNASVCNLLWGGNKFGDAFYRNSNLKILPYIQIEITFQCFHNNITDLRVQNSHHSLPFKLYFVHTSDSENWVWVFFEISISSQSDPRKV